MRLSFPYHVPAANNIIPLDTENLNVSAKKVSELHVLIDILNNFIQKNSFLSSDHQQHHHNFLLFLKIIS